MNDLSIQYAIKNYQYPKTMQEEVGVMRKLKFKAEIIIIKVTHKTE